MIWVQYVHIVHPDVQNMTGKKWFPTVNKPINPTCFTVVQNENVVGIEFSDSHDMFGFYTP